MDILVVEDNLQDAELLKLTLRRIPEVPNITHKDTVAAACSALRHTVYDVVLLDLNLPDSDGLATLRQLQQANDSIPIVVMTGYDDEDLAREAVHLGAEDYLVKGSGTPTSIIRSLNYAIERNHTAKELRYLAHHDALTRNRESRGLQPRARARSRPGRAHGEPGGRAHVEPRPLSLDQRDAGSRERRQVASRARAPTEGRIAPQRHARTAQG